ncbi:hypothetical protein L9F63_016884, partial [Diploptera punctata]
PVFVVADIEYRVKKLQVKWSLEMLQRMRMNIQIVSRMIFKENLISPLATIGKAHVENDLNIKKLHQLRSRKYAVINLELIYNICIQTLFQNK